MSSQAVSSFNFQFILDALADYAKQTGIDLTKNPFAVHLQSCDSPHAILQLLQENAKAFKDYRDGNRKLIDCLSPVVHILHAFSDVLNEGTSLVSPVDSFFLIMNLHFRPQVPFPPTKAIFVGVDILLAVYIFFHFFSLHLYHTRVN
jgi:hypothetical protein